MKAKKRSLLISVISLILCFSMLVGTTFAWFTDQVVSGKNTIAAGNLNVELYHSNAAVTNERVTSTTTLFLDMNGQPILWEPGVVSYENLRVANEGELALFYQLSLDAANENFVVYPDGTMYGLSQVLQVGVVEGGITATDRAGVLASVEDANWTTLASFMRNGSLLPQGQGETEKTWGLVIYWEPGGNDNLWNLNNGKTLSSGEVLSIELGVKLEATQYSAEVDSFNNQYDAKAMFPLLSLPVTGTAAVTPTDEGKVPTGGVQILADNVTVTVPEGTQLEPGVSELTLRITDMPETESNVVIGETEVMKSLDVHVEGVAEDNTVPLLVTMPRALVPGLNMGNYNLYHVEDGVTNVMASVSSLAELNAHNQFYYDAATGDLTLYMASFSEVVAVTDYLNPWKGGVDHSWYVGKSSPYSIANGDQLWSFSQIVGGMAANVEQDSFAGKTIYLTSDINLGDGEAKNNENIIFYPIGYYNSVKSYEKKDGISVTSNVSSFAGTFDGAGHTISNFYQNTWEMFGDYNDGYSGTPNHYKDAMGLFGYVLNGTVKNLTVENFSSDGEFTPTGVIAAYAVNSTFENIALFNCNPRVYNTGNGGIVGIGGNSDDPDTYKLIFNNITIDNTNKITALWGSWDVACGGLVGMFRGAGHVYMDNCHVGAQIDVYNDVCGNYQYYWYRYAGMMIGTNKNMVTDTDGYTVPETKKFHAQGCTVHFGDWNDYYYCELVANSLASYTHDHQMSRLELIDSESEIKDGDTWKKTGNFAVVDSATHTGTCYHIREDASGKLYQHRHQDAGYEAGIDEDKDGKDDLKEDKQIVYLPFNQLFTGYGWGVKHIPIYEGTNLMDEYPELQITILGRDEAKSVEKFREKEKFNNTITGTTVTVGDIFEAIDGSEVAIDGQNVVVSVSDITDTGITATYEADTSDWTKGTLTFPSNVNGMVKITIQDYNYCEPTFVIATVGTPSNAGNYVYQKAVAMTEKNTFVTAAADGKVTAVCPHCGTEEDWYPLNNNVSSKLVSQNYNHYYLSGELSSSGETRFQKAGNSYCLHLNGNNLKNTNTSSTVGAIRVDQNVTLTIMGDGTVSGPGLNYDNSGTMWYAGGAVDNRGMLNLCGGTYQSTRSDRPAVAMFSIGASNTYWLNVYEGTVITGNTTSSATSSPIRMNSSTHTINMFGGTISGGKATNGGNVYVLQGTFNLYGGTISDGTATTNGGNIYNAGGTVNIFGGIISDGTARNESTTAAAGGNVYAAGGTTTIAKGAQIEGGTAERGGNLAVAPGKTLSMTGGTVKNGTADNLGGNLYARGIFNMSGGEILSGHLLSDSGSGGSIGVHEGSVTISGGRVDGTLGGDQKDDGKNAKNGGLISLYSGTLTIEGTAELVNGTADTAKNIFIYNDSGAVVDSTLNIRGGFIDGGIIVHAARNGADDATLPEVDELHVNISGNPKISSKDGGIRLNAGAPIITIGTLIDGAEIYVSPANTGMFAQVGEDVGDISAYASVFRAVVSDYEIVAGTDDEANTLIYQKK